MRNQKGYTLVEFAITVGLTAIVASFIATSMVSYNTYKQQMMNSFEQSQDVTGGQRIILSDLKNSEISYNNLTMVDDDNRAFFDYIPDVGSQFSAATTTRTKTLKAPGDTFYLLENDLSAGPLLVYDPVAAYSVGATPADPNAAASLNYVSLNQNSWVTSRRPYFWREGQLLMLDTPALIRPTTALGVDYAHAPRSPVFVGAIQSQDFKSVSDLLALINMTHPETGQAIRSADEFLRTTPAVGGGQSLVRLRAVKLVKYHLESHPEPQFKKLSKLFKMVYGANGFGQPFLIADKLEAAKFYRYKLSQKVVYFQLIKGDSDPNSKGLRGN